MRYRKSLLAVVFLALISLAAWDGWAAASVQAEPANLTPIPEPATSTPIHPTHTPTPEATHTPLPEPTHTPLHTPPATPEPTHTPGGTIPPPTATPIQEGWDQARISTASACKDGRTIFNVLNSGRAMREPRPFWFLNVTGDTASCAADIANIANIIDSGVFQLGAGENVDLVVPDGIGLKTPLRILRAPVGF